MDESQVETVKDTLLANSETLLYVTTAGLSVVTLMLARRLKKLEKSTASFAQITATALTALQANQAGNKYK